MFYTAETLECEIQASGVKIFTCGTCLLQASCLLPNAYCLIEDTRVCALSMC